MGIIRASVFWNAFSEFKMLLLEILQKKNHMYKAKSLQLKINVILIYLSHCRKAKYQKIKSKTTFYFAQLLYSGS